MPLERIYSAFRKKKFEEGRAYIITGSNHLIEAKVYGTVIINVKSRTLSHDQIFEALMADDIGKINETLETVKLEEVQPATIKKIFRASAPFVLDPEDVSPQRLFCILRLMGQLAKTEGEGAEAFDVMVADISLRYPGFSLDKSDIKKRIATFASDFAVHSPFLNTETIPSGSRNIPDWLFNSIVIDDSLLKNITLYYIFFGELKPAYFKAIARREVGLAAKKGVARLSKVFYKNMVDSTAVHVFKGVTRAGEFSITWHSENKPEIFITQADLDSFGLKDSEAVGIAFVKK